jgi:hypothetical protein
MAIHVQTWSGSGSFRITDMAFAGRRGKKCRTLRVSGTHYAFPGEWKAALADQYTREAYALAERLADDAPDLDFGQAREMVAGLVREAHEQGVPEGYLSLYEEEIRGVDAPRPELAAGVEGKWSASADEEGVRLHALDDVNDWTEISHDQSPARAYELARKVWHKVKACASLRGASSVLCDAGVRLHGFCGMD